MSVGVELIDQQHKTWIEHYNKLVAAIEARQGPRELVETLGFLVDYTAFHFDAEEQLMADNDFPDLADHTTKHDELNDTLGNLIEDFQEEGATHILADFLQTFLGAWLIDHIRSVDMEFGKHLKEKGAEPNAEA
ncbi:MAG: bacteriohemerythrin [Phycisphaerae bacterium]|nr:bacteriohemerythrin [Phycisphaerae bacterium]MDP7289011.1 bacteriohemerythrin [Phycisphaerae bacterium]